MRKKIIDRRSDKSTFIPDKNEPKHAAEKPFKTKTFKDTPTERSSFSPKKERAPFNPTKKGDRYSDNSSDYKPREKKFSKPFGESRDKKFAKPFGDKPFKKAFSKDETPAPRRETYDKRFAERKVAKQEFRDTNIFQDKPAGSKEPESVRLNKYLAHAGVASRRKADELIANGRVRVNGKVILEMGYRLAPKDVVEFDENKLSAEKKVYILLNKPKDFITSTSDEKDRRTVMELIEGCYEQIQSLTKPRLYPVGRLDRNTTGVLLITNDGELSQNLTHPSSEIRKIYHVFLDKKLTQNDYNAILEGVQLEDGLAKVDELAYANPKDKSEVGVEIHSGKNRIVRRIFESLGYEVRKLDRVVFAGLTKKDLPRGRWRFLNEREIVLLKHFITKSTKQKLTRKDK